MFTLSDHEAFKGFLSSVPPESLDVVLRRLRLIRGQLSGIDHSSFSSSFPSDYERYCKAILLLDNLIIYLLDAE